MLARGLVSEDPIDRNPPPWHCRFRFGTLAATIRDRLFRLRGPVNVNAFFDGIDIPYDQRSGRKVVATFLSHLFLSGVAVVILAANFHREDRRTVEEAHRIRGQRTQVIGRIGTEGLTARSKYGDGEPHI